MSLKRCIRHLSTTGRTLRRLFPPTSLEAIEDAIRKSESEHRGEIRFAIESRLDVGPIVWGVTSRDRAVAVFAELRVWDTEENSGVLIYVLLADHKVEILADRGLVSSAPEGEWASICRQMEREFSAGRFESGALCGVREVGAILARTFPLTGPNPNELPDRPALL